MTFKGHIPNAITLLNLLSGCISVVYAIQEKFVIAAFFVGLGIVFDFFDGFAARKLKVTSNIGLQLDSLADMVTSGLVPGIVMYKLIEITIGHNSYNFANSNMVLLLPFIGFLITLASAYRLAKFNVSAPQDYFRGLPVPANTLLIVSLPLIVEFQDSDIINSTIFNLWFLIAITILSSYLLNSTIKLFALKFKTWNFKPNATRFIFVILCLVLLVILKFAAFPLIIALYLVMSILDQFISN